MIEEGSDGIAAPKEGMYRNQPWLNSTPEDREGVQKEIILRVNAVPCGRLHYKACRPLSIITNNRMQMNPCSHHGLSMHGGGGSLGVGVAQATPSFKTSVILL